MATGVKVTVQLVGGARQELQLEPQIVVAELREAIARAVDRPAALLKLVHKGRALADDSSIVKLQDGDMILAMPQRKAPAPHIVSAVVGGDDSGAQEEEGPARLPASAYAWEGAVVEALRSRARWPEWLLEWVVLLRPLRILLLLGFMLGCKAASMAGLGPIFVMACMVVAIFLNLGSKREGEFSAYSIFNPNVQRLPGTLDADEVDRQMRRGQI